MHRTVPSIKEVFPVLAPNVIIFIITFILITIIMIMSWM